jgi:hypothetical protein
MHINLPPLVAVTGSTRWQAVHSMAIVSKHLEKNREKLLDSARSIDLLSGKKKA